MFMKDCIYEVLQSALSVFESIYLSVYLRSVFSFS